MDSRSVSEMIGRNRRSNNSAKSLVRSVIKSKEKRMTKKHCHYLLVAAGWSLTHHHDDDIGRLVIALADLLAEDLA